jgi:hypothetical protein
MSLLIVLRSRAWVNTQVYITRVMEILTMRTPGWAGIILVILMGLSIVAFVGASFSANSSAPPEFGNVRTVTMSGTYVSYDVVVQILNHSLSISPGRPEVLLFNITSPVQGTFYVALGSPGQNLGPGLISNAYLPNLPTGMTIAYPHGQVITQTFDAASLSSILFSVKLTYSGSVSAAVPLVLYVYQHQASGPGLYAETKVSFTIQVG